MNMKLRLPESRLTDQRTLLTRLDQLRKQADETGRLGEVDPFQQQAFELIMGGASNAFDIEKKTIGATQCCRKYE